MPNYIIKVVVHVGPKQETVTMKVVAANKKDAQTKAAQAVFKSMDEKTKNVANFETHHKRVVEKEEYLSANQKKRAARKAQ